jgi:hypothetical protein
VEEELVLQRLPQVHYLQRQGQGGWKGQERELGQEWERELELELGQERELGQEQEQAASWGKP